MKIHGVKYLGMTTMLLISVRVYAFEGTAVKVNYATYPVAFENKSGTDISISGIFRVPDAIVYNGAKVDDAVALRDIEFKKTIPANKTEILDIPSAISYRTHSNQANKLEVSTVDKKKTTTFAVVSWRDAYEPQGTIKFKIELDAKKNLRVAPVNK